MFESLFYLKAEANVTAAGSDILDAAFKQAGHVGVHRLYPTVRTYTRAAVKRATTFLADMSRGEGDLVGLAVAYMQTSHKRVSDWPEVCTAAIYAAEDIDSGVYTLSQGKGSGRYVIAEHSDDERAMAASVLRAADAETLTTSAAHAFLAALGR